MQGVPQVPPDAKQNDPILKMTSWERGRPTLRIGTYHIKIHSADVCVSPEKLLEPGGSFEAVSANGVVAWFKLGLGLEHGHGMAIYDTFK